MFTIRIHHWTSVTLVATCLPLVAVVIGTAYTLVLHEKYTSSIVGRCDARLNLTNGPSDAWWVPRVPAVSWTITWFKPQRVIWITAVVCMLLVRVPMGAQCIHPCK